MKKDAVDIDLLRQAFGCESHACCLIDTQYFNCFYIRMNGHEAPNLVEQRQPLESVRRQQKRGQIRHRPGPVSAWRGIKNGCNGSTGFQYLRGKKIQQRPRACQNHFCVRQKPGCFQSNLRSTNCHNSRERPSGNRHRTFKGTGREDNALDAHDTTLTIFGNA